MTQTREQLAKKLENLSKEDLIHIIATMHDTIQDWGNGWGFTEEDSKILVDVGDACTSYMVVNYGHEWGKLPEINRKDNN